MDYASPAPSRSIPPTVTKGLREPSVQPSNNVVNRNFTPLLERAGLPPIRFRDLRHGCLSLLAQAGQPIRDLKAQGAGGMRSGSW